MKEQDRTPYRILSIAQGYEDQAADVLEAARVRAAEGGMAEGRRIGISEDGRIARARFEGIMTTRFSSGFGILNPSELADDLEAMLSSEAQIAILSIDSPGGDVLGTQSAADRIQAAMKKHPDKAVIVTTERVLASAAYWISAQADMIVANPEATVGSIGVIAMITDVSRMLDKMGIDLHVVRSGPLKAIGNGPLTDEMKAFIEAEVANNFQRFKTAVEDARGTSLSDEVLTGRTFRGDQGIDHGLIDQAGPVEDLLVGIVGGILQN